MVKLRDCVLLLLLPCGLALHSSCSAAAPEAAVHASALLRSGGPQLGRTAGAVEARRKAVPALPEAVNASDSHPEGVLVQLSEPLLSYWRSSLLPLLWDISALPGAAVLLWTFRILREKCSSKGDGSTGDRLQAAEAALGTEALTGFRCLLTLWVFAFHMQYTWLEGSGGFIVLAGCVLSVSRRQEPGRVKEPFKFGTSLLRFYTSRYVRIMPLYWVASLAIKPALQHDSSTRDPLGFLRRAATSFLEVLHEDPARVLICSRPDHEEWFIQTILICYLFYPLLERMMLGPPEQEPPTARWLLSIAAGAVAVKAGAIIAAISLRDQLTDTWFEVPVPWLGSVRFYSFPVFRLPDLALGAMIPHLATRDERWHYLSLCSDALFLVVVLAAALAPLPSGASPSEIAGFLFRMQIHGPVWAFALWGFCFSGKPSPVGGALGACYPKWLAKVSFGVYLFHVNVSMALGFHWTAQPSVSHAATMFATTVLLSWATAVLVEDTVETSVKAYLR